MKSLFTLFIAFFFMHLVSGQAVLTAVFDGPLPGGTPKGVEIYFTTDVEDLSLLGISSANNGSGATGTPEFTLPAGSATAGQYIYIASEADNFAAFFGFPADFVDPDGSVNINGDDAVELFYDGVVIDVFGDVDVDGTGEAWEHLDGWAARVAGTGPDGSTFQIASWTFSGPDALDNETTNATAVTPVPLKSYTGGMVTPDHIVSAINFEFVPKVLVADIGDVVEWQNTEGNHNVNGSLTTYPSNVNDFFSGAVAPAPWTYQYTFLNPGLSDYQCDQHVGAGMDGKVLVREAGDHHVDVQNNVFVPADITITLGETVVWTNASGFHNVNGSLATFPDNPEGFDNGPADLNWSYGHQFTIPGTYDYHCDPHAALNMVGTVTVVSPYPVRDMATIKQIDGDGNALYQDSLAEVTGIVYGPDFLNNGIEFFLIDGNNDGVLVRTSSSSPAYTVTEGDELTVSGSVNQFNGLIQLVPDVIAVNSSGNLLLSPELVMAPDESTEAAFITITELTLIDTADWPNAGSSGNVLAVHGTDTVLIRIDGDAGIDITAPLGVFDVIGLGSQFDNSSPYTGGYQILPRSNADIIDAVGTTTLQQVGVISIFPNPASDEFMMTSDREIQAISVFSSTGQLMIQQTVGNRDVHVNTSQLAPGLYFVRATTDLGSGVSPLMIR